MNYWLNNLYDLKIPTLRGWDFTLYASKLALYRCGLPITLISSVTCFCLRAENLQTFFSVCMISSAI